MGLPATFSSGNTSIATVNSAGSVSGVAPGSTSTNTFVSYFKQKTVDTCIISSVSNSAPVKVLQVQVTTADITQNRIDVNLAGPATASGSLRLEVTGTGVQSINTGTGSFAPGTYSFNFGLSTIPIGQYSTVTATWSVNGMDISGSRSVSFDVLGTYLHTQYNTPDESGCVGSAAAAYRTAANPSCVFNPITLRSDFIDQSWLNGSGIAIAFGAEQDEALCLNSSSAPPDAGGRSFRPVSAIVGSCGTAVSDSTVAKGDDAISLVCGDSILIVGLGAGTGTIKTVADRCAGCTGTHLDDYTTQAACVPKAIGNLGNFLTIRLR